MNDRRLAPAALALGAALALAACSSSSGVSSDRLRDAEAARDAAVAAAAAAEAEAARLRTLLADDGTPATPEEQRDVVQRTRAVLVENRTELADAAAMLARAPDAAATEKTREALTLTGDALASVDTALEAWGGAAPATSHGTPLENAHEALDLARAAIVAAQQANEPGAADSLTLASETVAVARAALTAQTVERLGELRDSLAEGTQRLAEQTRLRQAAETALARSEADLAAAEGRLQAAMAAQEKAETAAMQAETRQRAAEAALAEATGDAAEQARLLAVASAARRDAETARRTAEEARKTAEAARQEAETARQAADAARVTAEGLRDDALAEVAALTVTFGKDLRFGGREVSEPVTLMPQAPDIMLTPRRTGVELSQQATFDADGPWSVATDYDEVNYGTPNPDRLAIASDAVPYDADAPMMVIAPNGAAATVEFPGRGVVFRGAYYNNRDYQPARQGTYQPASVGATALLPAGDNTLPMNNPDRNNSQALNPNLGGHAVSSFQFDEEAGLTMKFGALPPDQKPEGADAAIARIWANAGQTMPPNAGDATRGSLIFGDLETYAAKGASANNCGTGNDQACDEMVTDDLTVAFGDPARDPSGEPAYYWNVDVPNPRREIATDGSRGDLAAPDSVVGNYEMILTNHIGDPADDDPADDTDNMADDRYLRYAAFGLFRFIDNQTAQRRTGRMQTIHYGFDAFHDGNRPPAATANSIAGTFTGRTVAWLLQANPSVRGQGKNGFVSGGVRMRGNVTLHACIGGGGCQTGDFTVPSVGVTLPANATDPNKITGAIHDLEYALNGGASGWTYRNSSEYHVSTNALGGDFLLDGDIDANGAFSGIVRGDPMPHDTDNTVPGDTHGYTKRATPATVSANYSMSGPNGYWQHGEFEGAFYGPQDALEAAGTWWAPATQDELTGASQIIGIVGSFGACVSGACMAPSN